MRPSYVYCALTVALLGLALAFAADPSASWIEGVDNLSPKVELDRHEAVDIARRHLAQDEQLLEGRLLTDARPTSEGGWSVQFRWSREGVLEIATVIIDAQGRVADYVH